MEQDKLLNVREVAAWLKLKVSTIQGWVWREKIPHVRLGSRVVRFSEQELRSWLEARSNVNLKKD